MKKTVILFSVIIISVITSSFLFTHSVYTADASGDYLRVITTDTPIYEDRAMSKMLFYLPYTYYVRIISVEGDAAHIEYSGDFAPAIDGYTHYSLLFKDGLSVENPYPALTVKTCKTAAFYSDYGLINNIRYVFPERNLYYYGYVSFGETYVYCVSYNGNLGYVKEDGLYPFTVADHPNELTFIKKEPEVEETFTETAINKENNTFILRIIVIGCLILAGLIAAFAVRRPKKSDSVAYYDENDFG